MEKLNPYIKTFGMSFMTMSCMLSLATIPATLASDHVDSPSVSVAGPKYASDVVDNLSGQVTKNAISTSAKPTIASGKPEDITDVYAFREGDQSGVLADNSKICLVMTLNGLQAPGQARPFAPDVAYQIRVATDKANLTTSGRTFSFRFGVPDANGIQQIYLSNSSTPSATSIGSTTGFNTTPVANNLTGADAGIKVFAGEMDDPFFLDFRVVNEGLFTGVTGATGITANQNTSRTPSDTFNASNVNAIVVSVPTSLLPAPVVANTYYVWGRTLK